jgi:hypothetical protein
LRLSSRPHLNYNIPMRAACAIILLITLTGCARYEFELVQPQELARHIATKTDQVVSIDPLEYRLQSMDGRLVMRIYNRTNDPIELLGSKSAVVDPRGQSHPLRDQTIAAQSFVKLIFPPMRPRVYDTGPTFGIGVGYHTGAYRSRGRYRNRNYYGDPYFASAYDYGPRYLALYDEGDAQYWDWTGQSTARVSLVFRRGGKEFRHDFTFARRKM